MSTHWRHKKTGGIYDLIGEGRMQSSRWLDGSGRLGPGNQGRVDMEEVAIYRSIDDGKFWVRPIEEFRDGRFERIELPNLQAALSHKGGGNGERSN